MSAAGAVERELMLVGLRGDADTFAAVIDLGAVFRTKVVSRTREAMVVELTGTPAKLDGFLAQLPRADLTQVLRTGPLVLSRDLGSDPAPRESGEGRVLRFSPVGPPARPLT